MLLLSTTMTFRGDSERALLWSDLFSVDVPMNDIGIGTCVKVGSLSLFSVTLEPLLMTLSPQALVIFADNAKHNQQGRTDEFGAFRHRLVELCPVGGLAMLFFAVFHILGLSVPNFAADFSNPKCGEWGKREWYGLHPFFTTDPLKPMLYESEPYIACTAGMPDSNHVSFRPS